MSWAGGGTVEKSSGNRKIGPETVDSVVLLVAQGVQFQSPNRNIIISSASKVRVGRYQVRGNDGTNGSSTDFVRMSVQMVHADVDADAGAGVGARCRCRCNAARHDGGGAQKYREQSSPWPHIIMLLVLGIRIPIGALPLANLQRKRLVRKRRPVKGNIKRQLFLRSRCR